VPASVTYWTGRWEPETEAISKELQALRVGERAKAPVVSIAPGQERSINISDRTLRLSTQLWPVLRAIAALIERSGDVSHVFGGFTSWHLLRALGRRPILLTAVTAGDGISQALPRIPDVVVVETDALTEEWTAAGVPQDRVRLIYPGVDLRAFSPLPRRPSNRLKLLFASSPSTPIEFEPRGVPLLIDVARARPDIDIIVPWRKWGMPSDTLKALAFLRPPSNFIVYHENVDDMRRLYYEADATIIPFDRVGGKACPNSMIEGLACGRPVVLVRNCSVARLMENSGAAIVVDRTVPGLCSAIDRLPFCLDYMAKRARIVAEQHFGIDRFIKEYCGLYENLSGRMLNGIPANATNLARRDAPEAQAESNAK
jgi:glycosyltransferase involved in cell wall biosynthesis